MKVEVVRTRTDRQVMEALKDDLLNSCVEASMKMADCDCLILVADTIEEVWRKLYPT